MDLSKMPNEQKVKLSSLYFKMGFFLLPFVWAVNAVWFFNDAFRKPPFEGQRDIRMYVIYSAIGTLIWIGILTAWITIFQLNRASWGDLGDDLSFIIPLGRS